LVNIKPKKMALKDITINSVETTEPVACLFKLKPSSRVPTIKGKRVAGELPITKAKPLHPLWQGYICS